MVNINLFKNNCVGYLSKFFLFNITVSFLLLNSTIWRKLSVGNNECFMSTELINTYKEYLRESSNSIIAA